MFEVPSLAAADFELTALSTFHPISLKTRFRNAFKGFKHEGREPSTRGKCNEKRSTTTLIHNRSESDIEQSNGADYAHKTSCPSSISTCCAAVSPSRTPAQNACTSLFSFDSSNNDSSSNDLLLKSDMTLETSDKNSCVANAKLPKDLIVALQFFNEMMRTDKTEMLLGSLEAIFDASIAFLSKLKHQAPLIQNALVALLDWAENKLEDCEAEQLKTMKREGVRLAADLQKTLGTGLRDGTQSEKVS
ncbi:unnamed protein product [Anisakis simplex]|uniref:Uncharacterized protein n=1 Tax=Anisakis simplex TaxID=6269 RepID=A0A0M3K1R5_ANISI|nr:unnamed protein product [Anisakis simplex]